MSKEEMIRIVKEYLSERLGCSVDDFDRDEMIFVKKDTKGYPFIEVLTMGKAVIVSTSIELYKKTSELLRGKNRDEMFECPLVYGQSIYYLPDLEFKRENSLNNKYQYKLFQGDEIKKLKNIKGFENSLVFDGCGITSTCIVLCAFKEKKIIGIASASHENEMMWEIGVDIQNEFRHEGLATILVSNLAKIILEKNIVPFYCSSTTNIASQRVAQNSGFSPWWVSTYRTVLDGSSSYNEMLKHLFDIL